MKILDAHTHVFPQYAEFAVRVMDRCGVACSVTAEWHDGFEQTLEEHLAVFNRFPGRFIVFGNVDFRRINEPGFARAAAEQMERDVGSGMRGLKVYKALGLEYRDENGELWRVNDERLDPIWAKAGDDLDAMPNVYYDISARIPTLGLPGRHAAHTRAFLVEFQGRILFGTDSIYDNTNVPTGMQAQYLYQPGEIPLGDADPHEKYVETSAAFIRSHIDFLTTGKVEDNPPFKRNKTGFSMQGLDLPAEVCGKIMWRTPDG